MKNIAVLLTCFNRKDKTLAALDHLFIAYNKTQEELSLKIYLTDDGSTDGTGQAVLNAYPETIVLQGNGDLFWAGGMRNSWNEAKKHKHDAYLLLNDDTFVYPNLFEQLLNTHNFSIDNFDATGIYLGSTKDKNTGKHTYGGAQLTNRFTFKYHFKKPNGSVQSCDLGNANIMLVTKKVVDSIGVLSDRFRHGVADYDYTLLAVKKNIPVLITPEYCGHCIHDHKDIYEDFADKSFKERVKLLNHPLGLDFKSNLNLMLRHFPIRVPFVFVAAALKLVMPNVYVKNLRKR